MKTTTSDYIVTYEQSRDFCIAFLSTLVWTSIKEGSEVRIQVTYLRDGHRKQMKEYGK